MNPGIDRSHDDPFAAIDRLAALERGWDSYDADPIARGALEEAKRLLYALGGAYPNPAVGPTPAGVELIWRSRVTEIHAIIRDIHDSSYVVLGHDRRVIDRGSISDYGLFGRHVLKGRLFF